MNAKLFDSPIFVRDGKHMIQEIASVGDAIDFLEAWPTRKRDLIHERTLDACYAAFDGRKPLIAAYVAFTSFAKREEILEDSESVAPWMTGNRSGGGRVPL